MKVAAIIIGIDGWDRYTKPLIDSIRRYEPTMLIDVIDNASEIPYPMPSGLGASVGRTRRLSYAAAINYAHDNMHWLHYAKDPRVHYEEPTPIIPDWYIVLSNDVLCTGPFAAMLRDQPPCVAGPQLWQEHGLSWIVGWCVCIHRTVWDDMGGWDEGYRLSSWEDVDFSVMAEKRGYPLVHLPTFPFVHLDQRQRFTLPGYAGSEGHNARHFARKHLGVTA